MLPPGDDLELSVCIQVIFLGAGHQTLPNQGTEAQQQIPPKLLLHLTAIWRNILEVTKISSAQPGISALSHLMLASI